MKKLFFIYPILILLLGFSYSNLIDDKVKTILTQFKVEESNAKDIVFSNTSGPSFYLPNVKVLKALATNDRVAMVEAVGQPVKEYTQSKEFLTKYNQFREDRKPSPPEQPKYSEQLKEEHKANLKNSIAEMEKSKAQMEKDQQAMFDGIIADMKKQLKDVDDPNNSMYTPQMDEYIKQSYQMQMDDYKNKLAEWEKEYPVNNPNSMIKEWLQTFLDKSANIDFNAKLKTDSKGKQTFVNPDYERKDYYWKLYFRAGKESVDAARKFAQNWMKELK